MPSLLWATITSQLQSTLEEHRKHGTPSRLTPADKPSSSSAKRWCNNNYYIGNIHFENISQKKKLASEALGVPVASKRNT
jgi:hypothetical protein